MTRPTIYDVAQEAGVSIATVSRVLNNRGKSTKATQALVYGAMERLNYHPSTIASALAGKGTYTLGLLVPDIANPFFAELARTMEDRGNELGYSIMICNTDNDEEKIEAYLSLLLQKRIDGLIIATGVKRRETLQHIRDAGVPGVLIARQEPSLEMHTVAVDDVEGGALAAAHLTELGHSRVAILAEGRTVKSTRERVNGFKQRLLRHGVEFQEAWLKVCDHTIDDGARKAAELLATEDRPTAIFACNDLLAVGAIQAAKQLGLRVPEDLSVIGFDNTILALVSGPTLTTVAQPLESLGKAAINLIVQELEGEQEPIQRVIMSPRLVVRESTAPPPAPGAGGASVPTV